jgi:hypothetical protein
VCFSLTVRKASNVRSREFKLYRISENELKSYHPDTFEIFQDIVNVNITRMEKFYEKTGGTKVKAEVLKGDTRKLLKINPDILHEESVTLVVTSPPYGDSRTTVAYGQFSRYPALWLGFDTKEVLEIDNVGLGGKTIDNDVYKLESPTLTKTYNAVAERDEHRAKELLSFFFDMDICLKQISMALKRGKSHCCFVLGNRTVKRVKVPTDQILVELGSKYGLKHVDTKYRRIPSKRIPWSNAPENIPGQIDETISKENIIIWEV